MVKLRRWLLGMKYQEIASELATFDYMPICLWSTEQILRAIELLEKEAELDIELAGYLREDGDEAGIRILNKNSRFNASKLWQLKSIMA